MSQQSDKEVKTAIGMNASVTAEHEPKPSGKSLTLLLGLGGIFLAVVCQVILMLLPFSSVMKAVICFGFVLAVIGVYWWQRYRVLMFIRWLEGKLGGKKTLH